MTDARQTVELNDTINPKTSVLEKDLGYFFQNRAFLDEALTHSSQVRGSDRPHNERLEFLGDAVLGLVISSELVARPERFHEGLLSRIRASLINELCLSQLASSLNLGAHLKLGRGEEKAEGRSKRSVLADAMEAVFGAIYLDGGMQAASEVILRLYRPLLEMPLEDRLTTDYKTALQELTQSMVKRAPSYYVVKKSGPDHDASYEVEVRFNGRILGRGQGESKKKASQGAAARALDFFRTHPGALDDLDKGNQP